MSKERLEEMEELLNEYYYNINDPFVTVDNAMAIIDKVGYFTNRVHELEKSEKEWVLYQVEVHGIINKLEQQNKNFREIIQDFIDHAEDYNIARVEKYHLRKTLELDE